MDRNFTRLLDLLTLVPRHGKLSTPQLHQRLRARGHDVSARTVQRDLEELATAYPIECDIRSKPFGWGWAAGAPHLSLPAMDWSEAVSFQLLSTYLHGILPDSVMDTLRPYVEEARRKLAQHVPGMPLKRWPERVRIIPPGPGFVAPKVPRPLHATVTEAVLMGCKLAIEYRAFDRQRAKRYVVSPLGLVQFGVVFYVPATFDGHGDVRTLKLHRMLRAELLDEPSGIEHFDLDAWLEAGGMGFGGQERIRLVLRLFDGMGERLKETPLGPDQVVVEEAPGVHRLEVTVIQTVQLERWLWGLGNSVAIVAPEALRGRMHDALISAIGRLSYSQYRFSAQTDIGKN
ncbi:hypothetical protein DEH84_00040 [Aquabacterium olei]|uniref:WYL domain-containing protein n=1 Tax=Aquabacterium olei TaxID=1296669 RepID=A0A2U8FNT5_9BURK|nr:WYL domain-containing transcriptional regulator [Aquabacterium olei]AWI52016.1 hypothetical protein DEH84_00040 [Aquabacterium olei]